MAPAGTLVGISPNMTGGDVREDKAVYSGTDISSQAAICSPRQQIWGSGLKSLGEEHDRQSRSPSPYFTVQHNQLSYVGMHTKVHRCHCAMNSSVDILSVTDLLKHSSRWVSEITCIDEMIRTNQITIFFRATVDRGSSSRQRCAMDYSRVGHPPQKTQHLLTTPSIGRFSFRMRCGAVRSSRTGSEPFFSSAGTTGPEWVRA